MYILFSDLDGTLLDHYTYSLEKAEEGIAMLKDHNVPLVLVSSKTFHEMDDIHAQLGLSSPFVFENGGGIAWKRGTDNEVQLMGEDSASLKDRADVLKKALSLPIRFITEMSVEEISKITGLPAEKALYARMRKASLPFMLSDNSGLTGEQMRRVNEKLSEHGLFITKGGRFYHFLSSDSNKGRAIKVVLDFYNSIMPDEVVSAGVGDSENDISMLISVDRPFIVRKPDGSVIDCDIKGINICEGIGPAGFTEAVKKLLDGS